MDEFLQRVERVIVSRRLLQRGDKVLVAVSGGVDSMVLLHALESLASKHGWVLTVAHFNHLLRGRAADADQRFVARVAEELIVPFESATADVKGFARAQKLSVEMAARTLRHQFFARRARDLGIKHVALAHHADDQVELFLLRLLRGASSSGLGGMNWASPSSADARVMLIRPLLDARKSDLAAWARENKIRFCEDATNASTDMLRNRIRHKLLPLLRRDYQRGIDQVILREAELLRDEAQLIGAEAECALHKGVKFEKLPPAIQRRMLHLELLRAGIAPEFELIERLRAAPGTWIDVDAELCCQRDEQGRVATCRQHLGSENAQTGCPRHTEQAAFAADAIEVNVSEPGSARIAEVFFEWNVKRGARLPSLGAHREFFDAGDVGNRVILRHWRRGDRFQPIGMRSPVKLQNLFTNQKIARKRRHTLIVATTADGEIFWVEGLRIGERFKVKPTTTEQIAWRWRRG